MPDDKPVNPPEFAEIPVVAPKGVPREYTRLIKLAVDAFYKGKAEEAAQLYRKAFGLYTQMAIDWVNFGIALEMMKQPELAMAASKRAISINPRNEDAWLNVGRLLLFNGNFDEAIEANKKVLEVNQKNAFALMNLGTCYDEKGDPTAAIVAYRKSLEINKKNGDAWFNLAKVQERVEDYDNAVRNYRQAIKLNPKDEIAKKNLLHAQEALKNAGKAAKTGPAATGKEPRLRSSVPLGPRFYDTKDMREKLTSAIVGGLFAIVTLTIMAFLVSCISDTVYATMTEPFSVYSNGSALNEVLSLWAVAVTPFTQLNLIDPTWIADWLYYLLPCAISGVILVAFGKGIKYTLVAGLFFIFWGFLLPVIFTLFLPLFFNVSPTSFNAALATSFPLTLRADPLTNIFIDFSSLYLGWSFSGAIQMAAASLVVALPLALVADLFRKATRK